MALINRLASHWRYLVSLSGAVGVIGTVASYVLVVSFAATLFSEPASAQHPFNIALTLIQIHRTSQAPSLMPVLSKPRCVTKVKSMSMSSSLPVEETPLGLPIHRMVGTV